ncbi:glycosyltransferase family 69 [Pochonia chlamydosporia 170]|uniref:Glycosyltransferase family 69 n=1 Tax=Pochonia chlamydosporia 170 TaxID=1380566 RepID=A0A179FM80_METCM|nr:glycosyltransferase family 69 [Pochonia chlamydosporia 170]OAQ66119.1 glycosyltransferase family 69 [Pochonia chlamydosporia 170]
MSRRLNLLTPPLILFFIFAFTFYIRRDQLLQPLTLTRHDGGIPSRPSWSLVEDGAILPSSNITQYLGAIFNAQSSTLPNLECPAINTTRYDALKVKGFSGPATKYFFALNLRQNLVLLPRLIGSIVEASRFLGPEHCTLSIVEGNSPDGTADVLSALRPALESVGITYYLKSSEIDPSEDDRIGRLARLRNLALAPLFDVPGKATKDTTVVFLNDVSACAEDILELLHQKKSLGADMTCAMDWTHAAKDPTFYDVWVARSIDGDSFFDIPPNGSWDSAWNIFWNAEKTRTRFLDKRPFQVFSCWNGATAFTAEPIIKQTVRFRSANEAAGECMQGEPQLFCKDLWAKGYRKIAVIPSVNLEYSIEKGKMIKEAKGFTSDNVANQDAAGDKIDWKGDPPEKVKCMPTWGNQYWQLWNETLK